ncbi:hypothetical protein [Mesorhizobium delmotii]|nr:hypothetical protein [Mesorhizobium delmotii]
MIFFIEKVVPALEIAPFRAERTRDLDIMARARNCASAPATTVIENG